MAARPFEGRRLHFVGIGGAGMSGLALVAGSLGAVVTGSDQAESAYSGPLRAAGIEPALGHDAANLPPGAEVVVSTAIPEDNPELAAARAAGARRPPPRRPAGRALAPEADDRGGRHARQDDHRLDDGARPAASAAATRRS